MKKYIPFKRRNEWFLKEENPYDKFADEYKDFESHAEFNAKAIVNHNEAKAEYSECELLETRQWTFLGNFDGWKQVIPSDDEPFLKDQFDAFFRDAFMYNPNQP